MLCGAEMKIQIKFNLLDCIYEAIDSDIPDDEFTPKSLIGYGKTEQEAIDNLKYKIDEMVCKDMQALTGY